MKKYLYEIWLVLAISIIIILSIITKASWIKIVASVCGVVYVLELSKENKYSQIFGLINTVIYAVLLINEKVYGTAIYNLVYCVPMLIYTYFTWGKKGKEFVVSRYSNSKRCYMIMGIIPLVLIYYIVATKFGVNFALVDGITIIVGMFAMYAIAKKKIEQWYCWTFVNIACLAMWVVQCIQDISNIPMAFMYVIYIINNCYGLHAWNKKIKSGKNTAH